MQNWFIVIHLQMDNFYTGESCGFFSHYHLTRFWNSIPTNFLKGLKSFLTWFICESYCTSSSARCTNPIFSNGNFYQWNVNCIIAFLLYFILNIVLFFLVVTGVWKGLSFWLLVILSFCHHTRFRQDAKFFYHHNRALKLLECIKPCSVVQGLERYGDGYLFFVFLGYCMVQNFLINALFQFKNLHLWLHMINFN